MGMPRPTPAPARADARAAVRRKPRRKRSPLGGLLIVAGLAAGTLALLKLELPRAFDKIVPQGLYRDVPPVAGLHPEVRAASERLAAQAKAAGIAVVFTDGFRSEAEQDAIYAQGRDREGRIVTHAKGGESFHNYGLAIDFALKDRSGDIIWDMEYDGNKNGRADWLEVADMAKRLGFSWGGDWEGFKDNPHLQMDFGYSIRELQLGNRPDGSLLADGTASGPPEKAE